LRTFVRGKRWDIGLGGLKLASLADAREEARKYRAIARNEGDPLAGKRRARKVVPTFRKGHHAALPYSEVSPFVQKLRGGRSYYLGCGL
jgi:hypothetical protein